MNEVRREGTAPMMFRRRRPLLRAPMVGGVSCPADSIAVGLLAAEEGALQ
jgi:hypothetical protein